MTLKVAVGSWRGTAPVLTKQLFSLRHGEPRAPSFVAAPEVANRGAEMTKEAFEKHRAETCESTRQSRIC